MYSIIDSCDETSGWHLPGLRNVKETALSLATQASPCEDGRNLATMSPAGLNILRCHKALLHTVGCTSQCCQERESVLSGMWLAPLWQASVTFQWLHVRPTQTVRHRNRLQHSGSNSWSRFSLKKHFFFCCSTTIRHSIQRVRDVSRVWLIFLLLSRPVGRKCDVWCHVPKFRFHRSSVER